jgi:orotidine-5'-phosphate decarboxylase
MKQCETNPIILALDVSTHEELTSLLDTVGNTVGMIKVGLELFIRFGPACITDIRERGYQVMLDLKLHDIPATVRKAVRNAVKHDVSLLTLHTMGGCTMMEAAREARDAVEGTTTRLLGVTLLTSIDADVLRSQLGVCADVTEYVRHLAESAHSSGLDGIVASPKEIEVVRKTCGDDFLIVTPGVRLPGANHHDQKRVCTPVEALQAGADYLVIGRPVTQAPNPALAAKNILATIRKERR